MAHAQNSVTIDRSPADVFAFLADGLNNPQWRDGVRKIELAGGEPGQVGAVYCQVLAGPGGRSIDGDYRITSATPGEELSFEVIAGPARPTGVYTLSASGDGTTVVFALDLTPKGVMRLMNSMITKTMEAEVAQLSALKRVLEV